MKLAESTEENRIVFSGAGSQGTSRRGGIINVKPMGPLYFSEISEGKLEGFIAIIGLDSGLPKVDLVNQEVRRSAMQCRRKGVLIKSRWMNS
jgi:hypothetical protein